MNSRKVYFGMVGLVFILVGCAAAFVIIGDRGLKEQSVALLDAKTESETLNQEQTALIKAKQDLKEYSELADITKAIVPQDKDQARAVREIVAIAGQSGIPIQSITFPESNLGNKPSQNRSSGDSQSSSTTQKKSPLTQAKPVPGIDGVYSLEMTIIPKTGEGAGVSYYRFLDFLKRLENNRRTAQVTQIRIDPLNNAATDEIDFSLTINIFVKS